MLLALIPMEAADENLQDFKDAIIAQDHENWSESIEILRRLQGQRSGDGERVRIYGTRYLSYFPHYYLGLALFKQGDCTGALKEWELSLGTERIQNAPECENLLKLQKDCHPRSH